MTNYLINPSDVIFKKIMKTNAENDEKYFINNPISSDINIFINISINSNGIVNFMNDVDEFINKNIKIYLLKQNNIIQDYLTINLTNDNKIKLINILGHIKLDYCTGYKKIIEDYIKDNNINNYFIYY